MKNERVPEIHRGRNARASSEKFNFTKNLAGVWRDLEDNQRWKYEESSPVRILEKLKLDKSPVDQDELARTEYFWSRRLCLLSVISYAVWLTVALGLPFWLFIVPTIGVPLLIISALVVNAEIVRYVRWRRQYEMSINRLIHTSIATAA